MYEATLFWEALRLDMTMRQRAPTAYAVVRYEDFKLHAFALKVRTWLTVTDVAGNLVNFVTCRSQDD